jgi:hypothetical protein
MVVRVGVPGSPDPPYKHILSTSGVANPNRSLGRIRKDFQKY